MKKWVLCCLLYGGVLSAQQRDYPISPVIFTQVQLTDAFWSPRIERNRTVTIPASFARCESTGRVSNFVMAAERKGKFCTKYPFDDTDIYKTIEGASYSLAVHPDPALKAYVDALIDTVARAQEPDGYLYTARTIDPLHPHPWSGPDRWVMEHELTRCTCIRAWLMWRRLRGTRTISRPSTGSGTIWPIRRSMYRAASGRYPAENASAGIMSCLIVRLIMRPVRRSGMCSGISGCSCCMATPNISTCWKRCYITVFSPA